MNLIGLPLPTALELLDSSPVVVETAPPFAPKNRVQVWGQARVLRVREVDGRIELLVGRELLGEQQTSSPAPL